MKTTSKNLSRRNFIKISGMSGAVLALGFSIPSAAKETTIVNTATTSANGIELNAWIRIDTTGKVTIINHRAEMGQGAYQAVPQIIAEELEVDLNNVDIIFAEGNGAKYGSQVTGGSTTVRGTYKKLLQLSATAREMLIHVAAKRWNTAPAECYAENGSVFHRSSGKKNRLWRTCNRCIQAGAAERCGPEKYPGLQDTSQAPAQAGYAAES